VDTVKKKKAQMIHIGRKCPKGWGEAKGEEVLRLVFAILILLATPVMAEQIEGDFDPDFVRTEIYSIEGWVGRTRKNVLEGYGKPDMSGKLADSNGEAMGYKTDGILVVFFLVDGRVFKASAVAVE
jgi:hypothetical protein